jgi:hypothetical protein
VAEVCGSGEEIKLAAGELRGIFSGSTNKLIGKKEGLYLGVKKPSTKQVKTKASGC